MTNGNYTVVLKNLGVVIYGYDQAASSSDTMNLNRAVTIDQWSDSTVENLPAVEIISAMQNTFKNATNAGPDAWKNGALTTITRLFKDEWFTGKLVHYTPASNSIEDILAAWQQEMVTDGKTFTTRSSTGIVHFLDVLMGSITTLDWEQSGSPTYADATYVKNTVS